MKDIRIFTGINEEDVNKILSECNIEIFNTGSEIITQGEESDGKGHIIKSGTVEVFVDGIQVATLGEGEVFGEIALLDEEARTATVIAATDVDTYILTQESLLEIVDNYSNAINKQIIERIEHNIKMVEEINLPETSGNSDELFF